MLKGLTNTIKNACNDIELTLSEYIVIGRKTIPIKAELNDDCYDNGNFVGTFILKELKFEASNEISYRNKEFEYYKRINGESIKIGTFITTEINNSDSEEVTKVVAMDYGLKTQVEYKSNLDYSSGNITLLDVWNECCELSGLESGVTEFTNSNFIVTDDQFTGTGATIRDVFIGIGLSSGSFIKVMNDDKIYPIFSEETDEIIEEYTELEDKRDTQPITCLRLGLSQIEGENVDIQDEELIKQYGENWLIINDNPFAYTRAKRVQLIDAIFNKVKGFGYSAFVSKTSFKPYLTCGDVIRFKNKAGELVKSIVLRYNHNFDEINLEAPSETSAAVNYVYPTKDIDLIKRTEIIVDKNTNQITSLTQQTTTIQNDLQQNYYDKTQTNQLIQTSNEGITNTFSEAGGNNIFRNTGLWFAQSDEENPYEYWTGKVERISNNKSANSNAMLIKKGTLTQDEKVPNGKYTVSFKYKKLIELADCKVKINDITYYLTETTDTEFVTGETNSEGEYITQPLNIDNNHIEISFISDTDNAIEIYDLMVNAGGVKLAYSQNQNETTTDTVNISKGITISSSNIETQFRANADGIRTINKSGEILSEFTDKGMKNKQMEVTDEAQIVNILIQNVNEQTWFTKL